MIVENILEKLATYNLSTVNKLFLINVLLKKEKIDKAKVLYQNEFQNYINDVINNKEISFFEIKETLHLLNKNNALLEIHSQDYRRLIDAYSGPDFSDFVSPLYSLQGIKNYLQKETKIGNISANDFAMILAQNKRFKEALAVLEQGQEKNADTIWRLICLMTVENEELFFECLENKLAYKEAEVELLIKAANYYLPKENIKKAKRLIPELSVYHQNIYKKEIALLCYKNDDIKGFKKNYKDIASLLVRIELLNTTSN